MKYAPNWMHVAKTRALIARLYVRPITLIMNFLRAVKPCMAVCVVSMSFGPVWVAPSFLSVCSAVKWGWNAMCCVLPGVCNPVSAMYRPKIRCAR